MAPRKRVKEESDVEGEGYDAAAGPVMKREDSEPARTRSSKRVKASHPNGESAGWKVAAIEGEEGVSAARSGSTTPQRRSTRNGSLSRTGSIARNRAITSSNLRVAKQPSSPRKAVKEEEVDELEEDLASSQTMEADVPAVKEEETPTSPVPPSARNDRTKEESMTPDELLIGPQQPSPSKKKDKGKQRAANQDDVDGPIAAAERVSRLEDELARLKAELANKSAVSTPAPE